MVRCQWPTQLQWCRSSRCRPCSRTPSLAPSLRAPSSKAYQQTCAGIWPWQYNINIVHNSTGSLNHFYGLLSGAKWFLMEEYRAELIFFWCWNVTPSLSRAFTNTCSNRHQQQAKQRHQNQQSGFDHHLQARCSLPWCPWITSKIRNDWSVWNFVL